jgi:signal transduction histidine kinase
MRRVVRRGCPRSLALSFWIGWVLAWFFAVVDPRAQTPAAAALLVVLLTGWVVLPWEPVRGWRRAVPMFFFLAVVACEFVGVGTIILPLLLVALANLVFSLGRVTAVCVAASVILLLLVGPVLARPTTELVVDAVALAVLALLAIALADAVLTERARRAEAVALVERVKELTIAEERARMARDMHDSLGHSLIAVKLSLELVVRMDARGERRQAREEITHAARIVSDALADTRRWVRALRPSALAGGMGSRAFEELADSFRGAGIRIVHSVEGDARRLSPATQLVAYRVVQESLANAVRHSAATRVDIRVVVGASTVSLSVADDGVGIGDAGSAVARGFGLAALDDRVRALGGSFAVNDVTRGGLEIAVVLPL